MAIRLAGDLTRDDGRYIKDLWDDGIQARESQDTGRYNNLAALYGHQYTIYDNVFKRWDNKLVPSFESRVHMQVNKLRTIMEARSSFITGSTPTIYVDAPSLETTDKQRAHTAQRIARAFWEKNDLDNKFHSTWEWTKSCGNSYGQIYYDPSEGKYVDEGSAGQGLFEGEIKYRTRSGLEIVPDPLAREWDEVRYVIAGSVLPIEEVETRWGDKLDVKQLRPEAYATAPTSIYEQYMQLNDPEKTAFHTRLSDQKGRQRNILILEYWEKPCKEYHKGRYIVVIDKQVVHEGELEVGEIPIVPFFDLREAGTLTAKTPVSDLLPLQECLNRFISRLIERAQMADLISLPRGGGFPSNPKKFAGQSIVIGYHNQWSGEAKYVSGGQIRQDYILNFKLIEEQMEDIAGVSSLATRQKTTSGMSGRLGYIVTEANQVLLQPISQGYRKSVESVVGLALKFIKKYYTEERTAIYINEYDKREVFRYYGKDIPGDSRVRIRLGQDLMRNPVATAQNALQMSQNPLIAQKIVSNDVAYKNWLNMVVPGMGHDWFIAEQDTGVAEDENYEFSQGGTPNPREYQDNIVHNKEHTRQLNSDEIRQWHPLFVRNLEEHVRRHEFQEDAKIRKLMWRMRGMGIDTQGQQGQQRIPGSPGVQPATPETGIQTMDRNLEAMTRQKFPGAPTQGG